MPVSDTPLGLLEDEDNRKMYNSSNSYNPSSFTPGTQKNGTSDDEAIEVQLKIAYNGDVIYLYIHSPMSLEQFWREIREACHFSPTQPREFTVKFIDEEGDPCAISSQFELDTAFRLYKINQDAEISLHIFPNVPPLPGMPCQGEDKHVYRRGARRYKKFYRINHHLFQAKRFNRSAACAICFGRVWGLGRQGLRCINCKVQVHKRCHKLVKTPCGQLPIHSSGSFAQITDGDDRTYVVARYPEGKYDKAKYTNAGLTLDEENHSAGVPAAPNDFVSVIPSPGLGVAHNEEVAVPSSKSRAISLEDFNLLKVIGRGSYAKVLQVEYKRTNQVYAMKVIKKTMMTEEEDIDWLQTEKHVFEVASNHPFLVGLHSCFQTNSRLFFVIEFVPGGDLMFHMQRQRRLHEEHARFYSAEIILALHFLHSNGIIYRDLKLDNVLIDAEGHIKLTDYGMCKEGMGAGDRTNTFCGTPNYIAPEILRGEEYSFSVDWWALGVLMYEMMAGRSPFDMVNMSDAPDQQTEDYLFQVILEKTIRIPRSLSVKAASILKGFLNKTPTERLGCNQDIERGFHDIKNHPFFKSVEWELLEQKQVSAPYKPTIKDDRDLEHFDRQFTDEPVQFTPDDTSRISKIDQTEFEGFEYVNPFLMTQNDAV